MDINECNKLKTWLSNNKVCFVTNSIGMPSSLLVSSLKTYIEYIPILNFWIINGIKNGEPFYGVSAFAFMLQYMLTYNYFDYVIYIDEDCFITDFEALIKEFKNFVNSKCCLAGPQDGGIFCHRNHSKLLINTFLSFWNISLLREKNIKFDDILKYTVNMLNEHKEDSFSLFLSELKKNEKLYNFMDNASNISVNNSLSYRLEHFPNGETPYCKVVRDDKTNMIEPNQIPYSSDDENIKANFEPYYAIEEALIMLTNTPIYYLFGTDLCDKEFIKNNAKFDISGLTSAIYYGEAEDTQEDHKLIAVHTWFSRAYTKWPTSQLQLDHTKRINSVIKHFSRI